MVEAPNQNSDLGLLSEYAPELADMLVQVASDIALVLNANGVIQDVLLGGTDVEALRMVSGDWVGRSLEETVTTDTRKKVEELLDDVSANGVSRLRHLSHPSPVGPDIPFAYTIVRLGKQGPLLAVGRDLRTVMAMQQRFTTTQQEMERNYWKMRQAESRYRLLFQIATDAVLVIDPATLLITDANHAAARLFGMTTEALAGKSPTVGIAPEFASSVERILSAALTAGHAAEVKVRLALGGRTARVSATPYNSHGPTVLLLRASLAADQLAAPGAQSTLAALVERTQDAIVVTDEKGNVVMANPAFTRMLDAEEEIQVIGCPLSGWLGTIERTVPLTISALVQNGVVPMVVARLRTEKGSVIRVELSATLLPADEDASFGFILRAKNVYSMDESRDAANPVSPRNLH